MKTINENRSRSFTATTPEEYDRCYADISHALAVEGFTGGTPEEDQNGMYHVFYSYPVRVPETVADEYELKGIKYYCKDCSNFQKGKNKRCKSQGCKYAEFGTVTDFTPACEWFYKQVLQGKIVPEED